MQNKWGPAARRFLSSLHAQNNITMQYGPVLHQILIVKELFKTSVCTVSHIPLSPLGSSNLGFSPDAYFWLLQHYCFGGSMAGWRHGKIRPSFTAFFIQPDEKQLLLPWLPWPGLLASLVKPFTFCSSLTVTSHSWCTVKTAARIFTKKSTGWKNLVFSINL